MMIVCSGASLGAVVHPLLLNTLFDRLGAKDTETGEDTGEGFANAVRASAGGYEITGDNEYL